MNIIKIFIAVAALFLISFDRYDESITATASTLDAAEANVEAQPKDVGASYKITGARVNNCAYVSAELIKSRLLV